MILDRNNNVNYFKKDVYYYMKDELGIIHAITTGSGFIIGRYEYNAFGYITSIVINYDVNDIMNINPIRYKSYYYDTESNMYYLNSRYYHPLLARFITPDSYKYIDIKDRKTYNLYTYCNNNPVNYADPEGTFGLLSFIVAAVVVAAVAATVSDIVQIATGNVNAEVTSNKNVKINNSYRIITPWAQYGYAFYLNHINNETKDIIKGTSMGVQFEWMCHNAAYYMGIKREQTKSLDVGETIFSDARSRLSSNSSKIDSDVLASIAMDIAYFSFLGFHAIFDFLEEFFK